MATEEETLGTGGFAVADADGTAGSDSAILERFSRVLDRFRGQILSEVSRKIVPEIESRLEGRIREFTAKSAGRAPGEGEFKDLITGILSATLFESGMIEKLIERKIDDFRRSLQSSFIAEARKEISALVQREIAAALGSENMKILIDEKFRAISVYLKTDVIPKTVAQILKASRKTV